jgi:hypothetical protein
MFIIFHRVAIFFSRNIIHNINTNKSRTWICSGNCSNVTNVVTLRAWKVTIADLPVKKKVGGAFVYMSCVNDSHI